MKNDRIEDIYRLSPVQEGMLFHALQAAGEGGAYLQQFVYTLEGEVDTEAFARAFQETVDRHPALRTAFVWERQGRPLQVVARRVTLPVIREDWPAATSDEERRALADLLARDRQRGFDLGKPPLLRLTLARAGTGVTYLVWTYHHLVLDGWSMALVLREAQARYRALAGGTPFDRQPPRPFRDYIVWLDRQDLAAAEAYWRRTLAGVEAATPLPAGETTGERTEGAGKRTLVLSDAVRDALQARAQRAGLTLNTLAQGAWALLLGRAAHLGEVIFGTVVSGRPAELPGVEEMVGMFINTLPTRVRIVPGQPLAAWLRDLQAAQLEMRRYEYSPLAKVQAWSEAPPGQPLFESILVFENRALFGAAPPSTGAGGGGPRLRPVEFQGETGYPLTAAIEPGQGLALTLAYDRRRFDGVTIQRWLGHLAALLSGLDGDLDRPVESLALLSPGERHQVLREWNDSRLPLADDCLHRLFTAQAARTPDAVALEDEDAQLTYGELERRANRLAHHLWRLGAGPDRVAGILLPRGNERILAVLAVLKAGGAYLPLDPEQPAARLAGILEDAGAGWLLTRRGMTDGLVGTGPRLVEMDTEAGAVAACPDTEPDGEPASGVEPRNLAYVIYTSGSTGRPKGVMMPHREIGSTFAWRQAEYPLGPADSILETTAFGFDATLWSVFAPLLHGARLVLSLPEGARGSSAVEERAIRHQITAMQLPPAWLRLFLEQLAVDGPGTDDCLRFVICGGEALTGELQEQFFSRLPRLGTGLHNFYGPTETALDASFWVCRRGESRDTLPIGRPIANKELYVLDRDMEPLPVGIAGELFIGGQGMARGYTGDPALTAARFVPHPWSAAPGARLYRSGDLARLLRDGNLEFLGRADHQVKVRGYRIELGEIEAVLGRHPGLRQVAVVTREDPPGAAKRLVAYVVPREESSPSTAELRAFLDERLPDYMVPAVFVELDGLPLKASGKLDRDRLPAPGSARPSLGHAFVPPRDEREESLAEIWKAVLGVDRVGVHDNFFELGGDSILSLQIVARARKAGLHLTTRHVFEHQTLADLAAELAAAGGGAPAVAAEQGAVTGEVPLTPIQHWFFDSVRTDRHHWNQAVLLAARRRLMPALLARALSALLVHHDALRLRFTSAEGGVRQRHAAPGEAAPLLLVDLTALAGLPAAARTAGLEAAAAAVQTALDLERGPLLRAALFDLGAAEPARLLLAVHHLVVDGVSWRLLIEDLTAAHEQAARGEEIRLPPKTTSFRHWAERLAEYARTPAVAAEAEYWLTAERTLPEMREPLPRDFPAGRNLEEDLRTVRVELSPEETRTLLREVPKTYGSRIEDVLLAAVALAFREWTGRPRLLVDLEGHGREDLFEDVDLSRTVGWFTVEYPVLLAAGEGGAGEALRAVKEELRRVPARGIGYGLLRYLQSDPALAERLRALPSAEVVFNYLGQFDGTLAEGAPWGPARESAGPPRSRRGERHYVFDLNGSVAGGRLFFDLGYSAGLHERATAERLAHGFLAALRRLIAHCAEPEAAGYAPSDFPLARTDQATLDRLAAAGHRLEDLYPLSPMQQGMLFDSLYGGEGVYVMQLACVLRGNLDEEAFAAAWQAVTGRHPVLRTAFVWEGCDQPLQMVLREVPPAMPLAMARDDWRGLDPAEQERRLEQLVAERRRCFDLTRAPLVRLDLIRLSDRAWRFLWSSHHLILDGWSTPMLFAELMALYEKPETELPERRPFRDYIAWLGRRDPAAAQQFFRRALAGYSGSRPLEPLLVPPERRRAGGTYSEVRKLLPAERTAELQAFARRHHLTLSMLVQGAWALVLGRLSDSRDVVFGATVAGRPAALAGVEGMVGMFINTLPVRLRVAPESPLVAWLREHQERQAEMAEHEDAPLAKIQQWCALPEGASLFESILVFENYPVPAGSSGKESGLEIGGFRYFIRESFPLILDVGPGAELSLRLKHDEGLYQTAALADTLADLEALLERFLAAPEAPLASLLELLGCRAEERREARRLELREAREGSLQRASRRRVEVSGA